MPQARELNDTERTSDASACTVLEDQATQPRAVGDAGDEEDRHQGFQENGM